MTSSARPELDVDDFPRRYAGRHQPRHTVVPGDLLIANTDLTQRRELLGAPLRVPDLGESPMLFSHHAFAVRFLPGRECWREFVYFALQQPEFRARAAGFAAGTTVLSLPRDAVLDHAIALPPERLRLAFTEVTRPLLARIDHASPGVARAGRAARSPAPGPGVRCPRAAARRRPAGRPLSSAG